MDERKKRILAAVIQDYIRTGEPVGSRTVARRYNLGVSPATIRNEMADLEELGLLEQPHTSAGRIPSDYGYRYFVDCLMAPEELTPEEQEYVRLRYNKKMMEIEQVLEETAKIISQMTSYTAIALAPNQNQGFLEQVEIVPIPLKSKALLVAITSTGMVEHKTFNVPQDVTSEDLKRISKFLNARLQGIAIEELCQEVLSDIYQELEGHREFFKGIIELLRQTILIDGYEKIYLDGTLNILSQPEFKDHESLKRILTFLEQDAALRRIFGTTSSKGLTIKIGQENKEECIDKCSVLTISYSVEGKLMGKVGLLGPTRMQYSRAVSVLQCVADSLSRVLQKIYC